MDHNGDWFVLSNIEIIEWSNLYLSWPLSEFQTPLVVFFIRWQLVEKDAREEISGPVDRYVRIITATSRALVKRWEELLTSGSNRYVWKERSRSITINDVHGCCSMRSDNALGWTSKLKFPHSRHEQQSVLLRVRFLQKTTRTIIHLCIDVPIRSECQRDSVSSECFNNQVSKQSLASNIIALSLIAFASFSPDHIVY